MKILSSDLAVITGGKLYGRSDLPVTDVITDSRLSAVSAGLVFFAIHGKNHDGHQFIINLYEKGIRVFVVERLMPEIKGFSDAAFIVAADSVKALQLLASHVRREFGSPVIAITGSTGKTIVKEWLADILSMTMPVIRSPRSFNSQVGVPLSVLKLDEKYKIAVFEAGISMPGEMENLRKIIEPEIGVITNIGDAHSENFPDNRAKAAEKLGLFKNSESIVYCHDDEIIHDLINSNEDIISKDLYGWSFADKNARIFIKKNIENGSHTRLSVTFNGGLHNFIIPFTDRASIENAVTVASVCLSLAISAEIIAKGLSGLAAVAMRMELKSGINNCRLIEDFYNSDPGSLAMAVEYLKSQKSRKATLILSDFVQSGREETELYGEVADLVRRSDIYRFIGIGKALLRNRDLFDNSCRFFETTDEFIRAFNSNEFQNEIILLKGARIFEFEKIAHLLEQQIHQTVLEVNLDAISHNINEFRKHIDPETRIMAMVKAFAYGAGPAEIAGLLEYQRISYLAVAYADEGVELRNAGVSLPVMVVNPDPAALDLMIGYSLEPEIFSFESLERFISAASRHGLMNYPVHIKIDSGMHRLGFMPADIPALCERIKSTDSIKIVSVFSHLAGSEDPLLDDFTHKQAAVFLNAAGQLSKATGYPFIRHLLNSAGIIRFPEYQFGMVRPGIGLYGAGRLEGIDLKPVSRFKTRISQIKKIPAGEPVGYNCADVSGDDRMIAILPVGYADGLKRKLGNRRGWLYIKNKHAPIIGNISMDMCMADITGIDVRTGDEAEIFGENITVDEVAALCGTIPYEILTSIPRRVKRVFFRE